MTAAARYHSPVTEKNVTGSRKPEWSGDIAAQRQRCGFFVALVRPVLGGRAGEPQGSPVLHRSSYPVRSPSRLGSGMAVTNRNWSKTMAIAIQGASAPSFVPVASPAQPALPRRRLAPNVIAMHAEERPPVVQTRSRGRLPACVTKVFVWRSRLYVGAICALRTPQNDDVPVRLLELRTNGECDIEAIGSRPIICGDGSTTRRATTSNQCLVRTATVGACHVR